MASIRSICEEALILDRGRLVAKGEVNDAVDRYLAQAAAETDEVVETNSFTVNSVQISSSHSPVIKTFDPVEVKVSFVPKAEVADAGLYVSILTSDLRRLTGLDFKDFATAPPLKAGEVCELGFAVESLPLLPGVYQLEVHLKDMARGLIETVPRAYQFEVAETQVYGGRKLDRWFGTIGLRARALHRPHDGAKAQGCGN
jgi:hypothetical protein